MKSFLFKEPLFRKILSGEKTETRRKIGNLCEFTVKILDGVRTQNAVMGKESLMQDSDTYNAIKKKARVKERETVYLKEPYLVTEQSLNGTKYRYAFDLDVESELRKNQTWKNKLFMPEAAARYFIDVHCLEVQFLDDICIYAIQREGTEVQKEDYIGSWRRLWNSINGEWKQTKDKDDNKCYVCYPYSSEDIPPVPERRKDIPHYAFCNPIVAVYNFEITNQK